MQKITHETREWRAINLELKELKGDVFEEKLLIFEDDRVVYHA